MVGSTAGGNGSNGDGTVDGEGAVDRPCALCGHDGHQHRVIETEEPGRTLRDTYCEGCSAPCEFVPVTED